MKTITIAGRQFILSIPAAREFVEDGQDLKALEAFMKLYVIDSRITGQNGPDLVKLLTPKRRQISVYALRDARSWYAERRAYAEGPAFDVAPFVASLGVYLGITREAHWNLGDLTMEELGEFLDLAEVAGVLERYVSSETNLVTLEGVEAAKAVVTEARRLEEEERQRIAELVVWNEHQTAPPTFRARLGQFGSGAVARTLSAIKAMLPEGASLATA